MYKVNFNLNNFKIHEFDTVIIGSGAAGLNSALHLVMEGVSPDKIAIITERLEGGTSFNAGSDKQTYYKLSIIGEQLDSPYEMAKTLSSGGAMHGDIALIEATNSIREFFHLIHLGVPFPHDSYGGYVGYKTDYDPRQRATSIGPLTSQKMCECLLKAVREKKVNIFNNSFAVKIIIDDTLAIPEVIGLLCIKKDVIKESKSIEDVLKSFIIFKVRNIILATGGPAQLYKNSVYPRSHQGSMGLAIEAGCKLQNLTESQFGIASVKFRWNLSGSYQQVIPRYYSVDKYDNEIEFLNNLFPSFKELSKAIFLKGYQWPFDSAKIENWGSSLIDLAIYHQKEKLRRKVFIDYTKNPQNYDFLNMDEIVKDYLTKSESVGDAPIERLRKLNKKAILIYKDNGIDINIEPIEIGVVNQHLNGGVACNDWWESINVKHLFAVGEVNGNHGISRPGGSALNSGQVGGLRAAQWIAHMNNDVKKINSRLFQQKADEYFNNLIIELEGLKATQNQNKVHNLTTRDIFDQVQARMSKYLTIIRPFNKLEEEIKTIQYQIKNLHQLVNISDYKDLINYFRVKDALITQLFFFEAIFNYHANNGASRGSYLILRDKLNEDLSEQLIIPPKQLSKYKLISSNLNYSNKIQSLHLVDDEIIVEWEEVRKIPTTFGWFETVWKDYIENNFYE
jgi:succinate dehydrogenase/fumarate reductase flavoprotein subunit